ncbi:hypothetical protein MTP99_014196 [Tenebrio molitor]|jgi:hypothetical protein|uniref:Cuticle protein 64-like n=1 Tax=Tenebrio molitor TaxID=7067 RepID=A0A8J6HTF8_TENMO|nr:hypothetical protein GEV33_003165 [Tenebrio molitor]KAJ3629830.1 hypothetical protein MTP99_014196 [Tenebrio molitor]
MLKLVVLSVVLAVAASAPAPGLLGGYALPAATSYSSRIDVHSKPLITTYAEPVVTKTVVASPISYAYPAVSHASYGIHGAPIVESYGLGHDYGLDYGYGFGHGYGYGHGW